MVKKLQPQLLLPCGRHNKVRNGSRAVVYNIANIYAAKVLFFGDIDKNLDEFQIRRDNEAIQKLSYESEIAFDLYEKGISIPRPIGIERILLYFKKAYPAFLMQYIPIPSGVDLSYPNCQRALKAAQSELSKAVDEGFIPGDDCLNPNNYLYDEKNNKVYLIDFERWDRE
jgi:RIO-like serine/threonine protein kinase